MYQQPLPAMYPWQMTAATPFMAPGAAIYGGWPGAGPQGFMHAPPPAAPAAAPPAHTHMMPSRGGDALDKFDKFSEDNWCKFRLNQYAL